VGELPHKGYRGPPPHRCYTLEFISSPSKAIFPLNTV